MLAVIVTLAAREINRRALPVALIAAEVAVKNTLNAVLDQAVGRTLGQLRPQDFYERQEALSVNSVLLNQVCSQLSVDISTGMAALGRQRVTVPYGALLGLDLFANLGPSFGVVILYGGTAQVDYSTKFEAVGINQVNYQVWLWVELSAQVLNPVGEAPILVSRKYALVNTVIKGEVPSLYMGGSNN
jgi:sporulation protein YunB